MIREMTNYDATSSAETQIINKIDLDAPVSSTGQAYQLRYEGFECCPEPIDLKQVIEGRATHRRAFIIKVCLSAGTHLPEDPGLS
jgi:hypothetical protein